MAHRPGQRGAPPRAGARPVPLLAGRIAGRIAGNGPLAMWAVKEAVRRSEGTSLDEALAIESEVGVAVFREVQGRGRGADGVHGEAGAEVHGHLSVPSARSPCRAERFRRPRAPVPAACENQPMRVLVSSPGGIGHATPLVPLARALAAAGAEVRVACPSPAAERLARIGLNVTRIGLSA